jgi:hypothetical protein
MWVFVHAQLFEDAVLGIKSYLATVTNDKLICTGSDVP